jgi:hypothetical protein
MSHFSNLAEFQRILGGYISGGYLRAPLPGKGRSNDAMSIKLADDDRIYVVTSFNPAFSWQECRDYIDGAMGIDRRRPPPLPSVEELLERMGARVRAMREEEAKRKATRELALTYWSQAVSPNGTLVHRYLLRRGLRDLPASIRCLDDFRMIVAVQNSRDEMIAAQITPIMPNLKRGDRRTFGARDDGAVRLGIAGAALGLAEGVETAMAAMQMTGVPTWAALGSSHMLKVWVPDCVRELHLFVDNDEAGFETAHKMIAKHKEAGRTVIPRRPPEECGDWNDYLNLTIDREGCGHILDTF